jgi:hypothetical protein
MRSDYRPSDHPDDHCPDKAKRRDGREEIELLLVGHGKASSSDHLVATILRPNGCDPNQNRRCTASTALETGVLAR